MREPGEGYASCPTDMGPNRFECPSGPEGGVLGLGLTPCGGNGYCAYWSGECECFDGYGGAACEVCLEGYKEVRRLWWSSTHAWL